MNEKLFQFIWQYSLYHPVELQTTKGDRIIVLSPGRRNTDSGPDFIHAKIQIGETVFAGQVELHLRSSQWWLHGHQHDEAYKNVILHVVFENDSLEEIANVPVVELKAHIQPDIINRYTYLLYTADTIPCTPHLAYVDEVIKESTLQRMLAERWEHKLDVWKTILDHAHGDWRQLLYEQLAINLGFRTNAYGFSCLAKSLPINILGRHRQNLLQIEALLFGQSGLLQVADNDAYVESLKAEYTFLASKYKLEPMAPHHWKFLRMRPANFPTIRIAQFAQLIHQSVDLFTQVIHEKEVKKIKRLFQLKASTYWDTHYRLGVPTAKSEVRQLGSASIENILINTIGPVKFLYGYLQGDGGMQEEAMSILQGIRPEKNHINDIYTALHWPAKDAAQSQAQLQLFHAYCEPKRCLECSIGLSVIRNRTNGT